MPCFDGRAEADQKETRARLDLATRLLCEVLRATPGLAMSPELLEWWDEHRKVDEKRADAGVWERLHSDWTDRYVALSHPSGALIWRLRAQKGDGLPAWFYASDNGKQGHADGKTARAQQPDLEEAKRLALLLVAR